MLVIDKINGHRAGVANPETGLGWDYEETSVGTEYVVSLAMALRQQWSFTRLEMTFSVVASFVVGIIYGTLDALIVTLLLSMKAGDQATQEKTQSLKAWMSARHLDRRMRALIMNNFTSRYKQTGIYDEPEILQSLSPQLRRQIGVHLYMALIKKMALFKNLEVELLAMLCCVVQHLDVAKVPATAMCSMVCACNYSTSAGHGSLRGGRRRSVCHLRY